MVSIEVRKVRGWFRVAIYDWPVMPCWNTVYDFDYHTHERIRIGRICRCGDCLCCTTKKEADALIPLLYNLNNPNK